MKDDEILVSINCITYNHERYIKKTLDSFLMQKTTFKFEIIIGEDCGTDLTKTIIEKYIEECPNKNIKLITSKENVGGRKNERRIFEESKGKYIAFCEGDDYWCDENKLQKQVEYMEKNEGCAMIFTNCYCLNDRTGEIKQIKKIQAGKYFVEEAIRNRGDFIPSASMLYRKELMEKPPEFYNKAPFGDYPMQIYFAMNKYIYCLEESMVVYRTNVQASWTTQQYSNLSKEKILKRDKGIVGILNDFNKSMNNKYSELIKEVNMPLNFSIYLIENKPTIKEVTKSEYANYYKNKTVKGKISTYLKSRHLNIYLKLVNLEYKLKGKF